MTAIRYAVPSHARADRIGGWTLSALGRAGVPADLIDVFVAPDELGAYRAALDPATYGQLLPGAFGLAEQHAAIDAHYGDGTRIVQLDDDLNSIVRRQNARQLAAVTDLPAEVAEAFALCDALGARLWGVYPTPNAGWMKPRVRPGLVFCIGQLFGHQVDSSLRLHLAQKDDYERTLRYWQADGVVLRVEWLACRGGMYRPGGLQADDQPDRAHLNAAAVDYLLRTWPENVRVAARTGKAGAEVRLVG